MSRKLIKIVRFEGEKVPGIIVDYKKYDGKKRFRVYRMFEDELLESGYTYVTKRGKEYINMIDKRKGKKIPAELQEKYETSSFEYDLKPVSQEESEKIKREQIKNFRWLNSQLEEPFDLDEVINLIRKVHIKKYKNSDKNGNEGNTLGFYRKNEIAFNDKDYLREDYVGSCLRFHEFIHYIQEKLQHKKEKIMEVLNEAQTESLAKKVYDIQKSSLLYFTTSKRKSIAIINFPGNDTYMLPVCLLRQMEAIMGRKSYEKNFYNAKEFSQEFIKRYGSELYTFLIIRMNLLEYSGGTNNDFFKQNKQYYLSETQDKLMKEAFRQDFERLTTIDDAVDMLKRLRLLENNRADIYVVGNERKIKSINHYKTYYENLYSRIGHKLLKKGYTKEEITSALEAYAYQKQEFSPLVLEEDVLGQLPSLVDFTIECFEEKDKFDGKNQKVSYLLRNNGDLFIGILDNKQKLKFCKAFSGRFSDFVLEHTGEEITIIDEIIESFENGETKEFDMKFFQNEKTL